MKKVFDPHSGFLVSDSTILILLLFLVLGFVGAFDGLMEAGSAPPTGPTPAAWGSGSPSATPRSGGRVSAVSHSVSCSSKNTRKPWAIAASVGRLATVGFADLLRSQVEQQQRLSRAIAEAETVRPLRGQVGDGS